MILIRVWILALFAAVATACTPKPLFGITYAPLVLNLDTICLPVEQVKKDMKTIATLAHSVRIYNIAVCYDNAIAILEAAKAADMTVLLGLWMEGPDPSVFEAELEALPGVMKEYESIIEYVIIGNEPGFIEEIDVDTIIKNYKRTKKVLKDGGYKHKTSVAEVWPYLESDVGQKLVKTLDFVCMNMQPYWEGFYTQCPSDFPECLDAGKYIHAKAQGLEDYFNKTVVLCEAGWPTKGESCCSGSRDNALEGFNAHPNPENSTYFLNDFVTMAKERKRMYYIHTIFDEEWKRIWDPCDECKGQQVSKFSEDECNGCVVDYNWGLYDYERKRKTAYKLPEPEAQCHLT
eukprot:g5359.t1